MIDASSGQTIESGKQERITENNYEESITKIISELGSHQIHAVGHRVVHGGAHFTKATVIDDEVMQAIESCVPLAPLHNPANITGIRCAQKALPDVPHVAVFDTAFHGRMPRRASTYAIPGDVAKAHNIKRYGFHGTSHEFVAQRAAAFLGRAVEDLRIVTLHLGNGCSGAAIEFGRSVDTTMGLTPLEGLVMGTRSGDVDAGVVLQLAKKLGVEETDNLLNRKSGLLGISGKASDLRDLEQLAADGHDGSRLAINVFAHRVRKYIGALATSMGGIDAVVLTGGIGENSANMRQRILQRLEFLGIRIDEDKNIDARVSESNPVARISSSKVEVLVVATNEALQIAKETNRAIGAAVTDTGRRPIPIAVSARHVHVTPEALAILFGEGHELTPYKPLSQPGQYACEEKVSIIGPRSRIDGVRILGPTRPGCQVEISRTDEFALGVDAPVRRSGKVKGSAPITLEGPKGKINLEEGLICARRHIHMTPEDAEHYGVSDGDEVEVAIRGGVRDLTFGDVLVRVKSSYKLEMHIDTDEANAAELGRTAEGALIYNDVYEEQVSVSAEIAGKR